MTTKWKRWTAPLMCSAGLTLSSVIGDCATYGQTALRPAPAAAPTPPNQTSSEEVLSRFRGGQVSVGDLREAMANGDPRARRVLATKEGRLSLLRDLENYELLILEAELRGYAERPAVRNAKRRAAIDALLANEFAVDPASIPAADVARELSTQRAAGVLPRKSPSSDLEKKEREYLAKQREEQARNEFVKRVWDEHQPEIHPELIGAIALTRSARLDLPNGFSPAPPDPRAAPRRVESDGF